MNNKYLDNLELFLNSQYRLTYDYLRTYLKFKRNKNELIELLLTLDYVYDNFTSLTQTIKVNGIKLMKKNILESIQVILKFSDIELETTKKKEYSLNEETRTYKMYHRLLNKLKN